MANGSYSAAPLHSPVTGNVLPRATKRRCAARAASTAPLVPSKRLLKRRPSAGRPPELNCIDVQAVWGGHMKVPTVIWPLLERDGRRFVPIHERLFWLRRVCDEKKGQTHWSDTFQYAVSKLREVLKEAARKLKLDV